MNEMYAQVREHLRQQHDANTQEIHGKKVDNFNKYGYYGNDGKMNGECAASAQSNSSFFGTKVLLFLVSVMVFSCYIYGGQDIRKGATMAWEEMKVGIAKLEKEEPVVKEAMSYVRKAYDEVEDFTKTYLNVGE